MLKFSANLGMMFGEEEDPIKRMELAKTSGFGAVEYLFVYDMSLEILKSESSRLGLGWSVVNIASRSTSTASVPSSQPRPSTASASASGSAAPVSASGDEARTKKRRAQCFCCAAHDITQ